MMPCCLEAVNRHYHHYLSIPPSKKQNPSLNPCLEKTHLTHPWKGHLGSDKNYMDEYYAFVSCTRWAMLLKDVEGCWFLMVPHCLRMVSDVWPCGSLQIPQDPKNAKMHVPLAMPTGWPRNRKLRTELATCIKQTCLQMYIWFFCKNILWRSGGKNIQVCWFCHVLPHLFELVGEVSDGSAKTMEGSWHPPFLDRSLNRV